MTNNTFAESIIYKLRQEQHKYEWDDYTFPVSRSQIASYHAFDRAIEIIKDTMEKVKDDSFT